jgi:hypothetical protein
MMDPINPNKQMVVPVSQTVSYPGEVGISDE